MRPARYAVVAVTSAATLALISCLPAPAAGPSTSLPPTRLSVPAGTAGSATPRHAPSTPTKRGPAPTPSETRAPSPTSPPPTPTQATEQTQTPASAAAGAPIYSYRIVNVYPHDPNAYTQGLAFVDGRLYEGTGRYGHSSLREVDLETGDVIRSVDLPDSLFGEGIAVVGDRIVQLSWREHTGRVYDTASFRLLSEFYYPTEGWGLAYDGERLVMSDGSATLHFLHPATFEQIDQIQVRDGEVPVPHLNELEFAGDVLLANVWGTDRIALINPATGEVVGWLDLTRLLDEIPLEQPVDVLNGIAYNEDTGRLFVTGKLWPALFEIELADEPSHPGAG